MLSQLSRLRRLTVVHAQLDASAGLCLAALLPHLPRIEFVNLEGNRFDPRVDGLLRGLSAGDLELRV